MQARHALAVLRDATAVIVDGTDSALASAAASGLQDNVAAQLHKAAGGLRQQWEERLAGVPDDLAPAQHASLLRPLLQRTAELAALMQQYYALPALAAERQLAVAQASAGRSCAYLRCANLGGEGGPAAGQGVGSKRCRWAGVWVTDGMVDELAQS